MHHHPRSPRCLARSGNCFGDDRPRRTVSAWPAERAFRIVIDRAPAARQGPTAPIQDNLVNRLCKLCVLLL